MDPAETDVVDDKQQVEGQETAEGDQTEEQKSGTDHTEGDEGTDAEEVVVTIGDEEPPAPEEDENGAPDWVRELRKLNREKDKRIRELEAKVTATAAPEKAVAVGEEPTLEGCDYDTERFKTEFKAWTERTREAEQQEAKKRDAAETEKKSWQGKLDAYGKAKTELKVKDFEDAEAVVTENLSITQQGVILHGADNPALLIYALGRDSKRAKELAAITDPVKFAFAVAKLETQLKVTPRKSAPVPDKTVRGSAPVTGTVDKKLQELEAKAEKTGDRSEIVRYKRALKAKQQ